jgi:hypothetical protein
LEVIAEEEWKVKRELLLQKRVKLYLYHLCPAYSPECTNKNTCIFSIYIKVRNEKFHDN